jgi:4-methylaminobutanoate oxidase (formaldehyde-forming)
MTDWPSEVDVVIIGGGALGAAIAWGLVREGVRDVVVLEKAAITHGSTWHAAGLVGQYRSREDLTRLMLASVAHLDAIEAETPIGWRRVGSLRLASSAARWREYQNSATKARSYGVDFELIDPIEARRRFPYLDLHGVEGAAFVHGDGYVDPTSLTNAYVARARAGGVRFYEETPVTALAKTGASSFRIETTRGPLECRRLVLAPGVWARAVGRWLDLPLAVAALEHQYAVTEKVPNMPANLPALRDPDLNFYLKPETGAFAIGGWEAATVPVYDSDMPAGFGRTLLPDALDRLQPILEAAGRRLPLASRLGLRQIINGPIPVTPDGEPILGPAPQVEGLFLAIGFTSGIAASAGAGQLLAEWIARGAPSVPLPSLDPARFADVGWDTPRLHTRAIAAYASYYALSSAAVAA